MKEYLKPIIEEETIEIEDICSASQVMNAPTDDFVPDAPGGDGGEL